MIPKAVFSYRSPPIVCCTTTNMASNAKITMVLQNILILFILFESAHATVSNKQILQLPVERVNTTSRQAGTFGFTECMQSAVNCFSDRDAQKCWYCEYYCIAAGAVLLADLRNYFGPNSNSFRSIRAAVNFCPLLLDGALSYACRAQRNTITQKQPEGTCTTAFYKFVKSPAYGGSKGGEEFDMQKDGLESNQRLSKISIQASERVTAIAFKTILPGGSSKSFSYGGDQRKGDISDWILWREPEKIIRFETCIAKYRSLRLYSVTFLTSQGQVLSGGNDNGDCLWRGGKRYKYIVPKDHEVVGGYGRQGDGIDQLGLIMKQYTPFKYVYGNTHGGPHGTKFDDADGMSKDEFVRSISLRSGRRVNQVKFVTNRQILTHGGNGGGPGKVLDLSGGHRILSMVVCTGKYRRRTRVFYIKFVTEAGFVDGGEKTGSCATENVPNEHVAVGLHGSSGAELDQVGLVMRLYQF